MTLKELTLENHKKAERCSFAGILMSGRIDPYLYYRYLTNQLYVYSTLEQYLPLSKYDIEDIARADLIFQDIQELEQENGFEVSEELIAKSTTDYMDYVNKLAKKDPQSLIAHMYVRHFGDMYGGAIIAKRVPGSGKMYQFEDKERLKAKVRDILTLDMADEANVCFEYAIRLFNELGGVNE